MDSTYDFSYKLRLLEKQLNSELNVLQHQLNNVDKKIDDLYLSLKYYIGLVFLVPLGFNILTIPFIWISNGTSILDQMIGELIASLIVLLNSLYILFLLPGFIYKLLETISFIYLNRKSEKSIIAMPGERSQSFYYRQPYTSKEVSTFAVEKKQILWVMHKYYMSLETVQKHIELIETNPDIDSKEVDTILNQIVFYETVPVATLSGNSARKARILSVSFIIVAIVFMLAYCYLRQFI